MDADYQTRHRHGDTLFPLPPAELTRRLDYLRDTRHRSLASRQRPDARPGVDAPETLYLEGGHAERPARLVAVARHDGARMTGHDALASEPAAMQPPRSPEALLAFAEMAKNGGQYPAANAAVALVLHRFFPRVECSLSVRESPATPTGAMADGYYDLAYVAAGDEETCIPIPKLRPSIAYWFAAHAERRAPQPHNRDTSGDGPTLADLTALLGEDPVEEAMAAVLADA